MHIHILGISGTFMSGLALLAREMGMRVTGSDMHCYPPTSDLLSAQGIEWTEGYEVCQAALVADQVIIGNAIKRGMPVLEAVLDAHRPYTSGPEWLATNVLSRRRVLAISGTHGKTTTTSMLAFILQHAGLAPGFLIGGVAPNFGVNARLGHGDCFVIEADEYDSAFFDKRPKFMHYRPDVAILNNLEFDHADIYPDLASIQRQFHYFLRTVPASGLVLYPRDDDALNQVLQQGLWSKTQTLAWSGDASWRATLLDESGTSFAVYHDGVHVTTVEWPLIGRFNVENGLAALAASVHVGVSPDVAAAALAQFAPVKRRLEVKSNAHGVTVYDDFAHHPTAIEKTIHALKRSGRHRRIIVVMEFASYTMRTGVHGARIGGALADADVVYILKPSDFTLDDCLAGLTHPPIVLPTTDAIVDAVGEIAQSGDAILVMSNRGFDGIHQRLSAAIAISRYAREDVGGGELPKFNVFDNKLHYQP